MSNIFTNITRISDKPSLRKTESVMSNFNELKNDQLKNCELVHLKVWKRDGRVFKHRKLGFRIRTTVEEALSFGFSFFFFFDSSVHIFYYKGLCNSNFERPSASPSSLNFINLIKCTTVTPI